MDEVRRCVDCTRFALRTSALAQYGFGRCTVRSMSAGHTFSAVRPHVCTRFNAATSEVADKRMAWLKAKGAV